MHAAPLKMVTIGLAIFTYSSFTLAVITVFRRGRLRHPFGFKLISVFAGISKVTILICLFNTHFTGSAAQVTGMILFLLSGFVFYQANRANRHKILFLAYEKHVPAVLLTSGPYRWVRHPYYSSYLLGYSAGCLSIGLPLSWIIVAIGFAIYYFAARFEESNLVQSELGAAYLKMQKTTGMFLPRLSLFRTLLKKNAKEIPLSKAS